MGLDLLAIRTRLRTVSGRHDLVNSDYTDNGMDFYIQAGSRLLDLTVEQENQWATYRKQLASGDYKTTFSQCRAIHRVWLYSSSTNRIPLVEKSLEWILNNYTKEFDSVDTGTPKYYAPFVTRLQPDQQDNWASEADFLADGSADFDEDYNDIIFGTTNYLTNKGILLMPRADSAFTVRVFGKFWSNTLSAETDKNIWSENFPEALVYATMQCLEKDYRNTRGIQDWQAAMESITRNIEFDMLEQNWANVSRMEG